MRRLLTPLAWSLADTLTGEAGMEGLTVGSLRQLLRARDSSHSTPSQQRGTAEVLPAPSVHARGALIFGFILFHYWGVTQSEGSPSLSRCLNLKSPRRHTPGVFPEEKIPTPTGSTATEPPHTSVATTRLRCHHTLALTFPRPLFPPCFPSPAGRTPRRQ